MNFIDFHTFIGTGGAPIIERTVELIKVQFRLSSTLAAWMVLPLSIVLEYGIGIFYHLTPDQMGIGLATLLLSVWGVHEASK